MAFKPKGKAGLKKKDDKGRNNLFKRRKFCRFTAEKIEHVDYKDVEILKDFINARLLRFPFFVGHRIETFVGISTRSRSSARVFWH